MAVTSNSYTANGSQVNFALSFPYIKKADVKVYVSGILQTLTTHYTFNTANIIQFVTAPAAASSILIDRATDAETIQAVFSPGSAIQAADLNADFRQTLYVSQEIVDESTAANINAGLALASVSSFLPYTIVASVANIPASPTSGQRVEILNSTGIQSFTPLSGLPAGFIGATNLRVRLQWNTPTAATWNWSEYTAVDPDGRYIRPSQLSSSVVSVSATTGASSAAAKLAADAAAAAQVTANQAAPPSTVAYVAQATAPSGWLKANGAAVGRTAYAALYAAVGTLYGVGDGTTTFNLPDLRGAFIRSFDDGRGVYDPGRALGTVQTSANLSHTHTVTDPTHAHSVYDPTHAHGLDDPGHAHGIADPGHAHGYARQDWGAPAPILAGYTCGAALSSTTSTSGTGIGMYLAGTGMGMYGAGTGIGIYGAGTGISLVAAGGTESRPTNVALLAVIKY